MGRCLVAGFELCWRAHVLVSVLLLGSVPAAWTRSDTLNIDCGSSSSYVDSVAGLTWVPDAPYISSGKTWTLTLPASLQSHTEMQTLRYFDDARAKNCYTLPVIDNTTYILKLTFYYGNYDNANAPPMFRVAVDANVVSNVTVEAGAEFSYTEYQYTSRGNATYVCLLRQASGGVPFISGISLAEAMQLVRGYSSLVIRDFLAAGMVLITRNRVNYGGWNLIRAPEDYYDRFWVAENSSSRYYLTPQLDPGVFLLTNLPIAGYVNSLTGPPSAVLQTAVSTIPYPDLLFPPPSGLPPPGPPSVVVPYGGSTSTAWPIKTYVLPPGSPDIEAVFVYYIFYFVELNSSSNPPLRNFTIDVPDQGYFEWDVIHDMENEGFLNVSTVQWFVGDWILNTTTTVILRPDEYSETGPILNAMEVFTISDSRRAKTGVREALAIEGIKMSFNLTEWTGDPCLPFPHAWINCSSPSPDSKDPAPLITALNLSGYHLKGMLPASFATLRDLTSLDLSNNDLNGSLPEWLITLTDLRFLAVQNNNFSGKIPEGLLPPNSQIRLTYYGNPLLVRPGPVSPPGPGPASPPDGKSNIGIIAGAGGGGAAAVILGTLVAIWVYCRRKCKPKLPEEVPTAPTRIANPAVAKAYTFAEINAATAQFKKKLGRGGFGPVYYGKLPDGKEVAVKVADGTSKDEDREFSNEVDVLSRVHHKNLVALVGYCQEQKKQVLIYEYMRNGSVYDHLHGSSMSTGILDWRMRLRIALDAAEGLQYLHTCCRPSLIHRDVKSSNILLSSHFEAKVADFGLTKPLGEAEGAGVMTNNVVGTEGYIDPEYHASYFISSKSDVYSFGIVLLELITGCPPIEKASSKRSNPSIGNWVRESLHKNDITSILDPKVVASNPKMEAIRKVANVAMQCIESKAVHRPTMFDVVEELKLALGIEEGAKVPFTQVPMVYPLRPSGPSNDCSNGKVPYVATSHSSHQSGLSNFSSSASSAPSTPR